MRRWLLATALGFLSASMGVLIRMPTRPSLFVPQILLNEFGWIPFGLGATAIVLGGWRKPRTRLGMIFGLYGMSLAAVPYTQMRRAARDMADAMRAGLGPDYEQAIPTAMLPRMAPAPWTVRGSLLARRRAPDVQIDRDIVYARPGIRRLKLDVYRPCFPPVVGDRYPAVIVIHGGSWRRGNKGGIFSPHSRYLARQGYVVFDIQYRLSGEARWPAQLHDVHTAIAWVKARADEYGIDPARIALLGRSAGGHLALSAAYRADEFDASLKIAAVVAIYPPTDLRLWPPMPDTPLTALLGGMHPDLPGEYADASPIEFCRDDLPPTLLAQGGMDNLVEPTHARLLAARLRCTNTPVVSLHVPWARHGFDAIMAGLSAQVAQYHIDRFLAWSLYRDASNGDAARA